MKKGGPKTTRNIFAECRVWSFMFGGWDKNMDRGKWKWYRYKYKKEQEGQEQNVIKRHFLHKIYSIKKDILL